MNCTAAAVCEGRTFLLDTFFFPCFFFTVLCFWHYVPSSSWKFSLFQWLLQLSWAREFTSTTTSTLTSSPRHPNQDDKQHLIFSPILFLFKRIVQNLKESQKLSWLNISFHRKKSSANGSNSNQCCRESMDAMDWYPGRWIFNVPWACKESSRIAQILRMEKEI